MQKSPSEFNHNLPSSSSTVEFFQLDWRAERREFRKSSRNRFLNSSAPWMVNEEYKNACQNQF